MTEVVFRRYGMLMTSSATKLQKNYEISLSGELNQHNQYIICHVMCDEIGLLSPASACPLLLTN